MICLPQKFDFLKTNKHGCTLGAILFTSMATGQNILSVIEELSLYAFCKIAPPLLPRRGYPELPSDNPLASYIFIRSKTQFSRS
jgi:hypothetical protein